MQTPWSQLVGALWGIACLTFTALAADQQEKSINFTLKSGTYVKFLSFSEVSGYPWTSAAEIRLLGTLSATHPTPTPTPIVAGPQIGVSGDKFTINGQKKFLLGVSYFDVLGWKASDLDALQARKFNLVRAWTDFPARGIFDVFGNLDQAKGATVLNFVRASATRGIIVDVTLLYNYLQLKDLNAARNAVRSAVTLLKNEPNVMFDLVNEHNLEDYWARDHAVIQQLISEARAVAPTAIVFASNFEELITDITVTTENQAMINEEVNTLKFNALAPHFFRYPDWYDKTDQRIGAIKNYLNQIGKALPIYLQEEARRGYGGLNPTKDQFIQAARESRDAGAAGWIFHTNAAFDLAGTKTFFGNLDPDASGVEKATVDALGDEIFGTVPIPSPPSLPM